MEEKRIRKLWLTFCMVFLCFIISGVCGVKKLHASTRDDGGGEIENSKTTSIAITHVHSGSSSSGGGCYGNHHSNTVDIRCNKPFTKIAWDTCVCSDGHSITNTVEGGYDTWPIPSGCGVVLSSTTEYYYTVNCGMTDSVIGSLSVTQSPINWTRSVQLDAVYDTSGGLVLKEAPVLFTGNGLNQEVESITVNQNGIYVCQLQTDSETTDADMSVVTCVVNNIDDMPPTIESFDYDDTRFLKEVFVEVVARDLQIDGSEGVGLAEFPYSYDGGSTWVEEANFLIVENGDYEVQVKDELQQISSGIVTVTVLDVMGPTITDIVQEKEGNVSSVKVTVVAHDIQEDGGGGIGMPLDAYSFDEGETWQGLEYISYYSNGIYSIWVRDLLENITIADIEIDQFPEKQQQLVEESVLNNENKVVEIEAKLEEVIVETEEIEEAEEEIEEVLEFFKEVDRVIRVELPEINRDKVEEYTLDNKEVKNEEIQTTIEVNENKNNKYEEVVDMEKPISFLESIKKILLVSTVGAFIISGIAGTLYGAFFGVVVFSGTSESKKRFLGIARLRSGERLEIFVRKRILEKNNTSNYIFKVNKIVAKKYELEPILIKMEGDVILKSIERYIELEME